MKNPFHEEILARIKEKSGKPTNHTFLDSYLGNTNFRYAINAPSLRLIAREWMRAHRDLTPQQFAGLLTSLIQAKSSTEKMMAGILLGYATSDQRKFNPELFHQWLDYLHGWAEVDAVCTGNFTATEMSANWPRWKKLLTKLSKDENINKRRASLVLLCSPLSRLHDERIVETALKNVDRLKTEREILITKAISWLLRSMTRHYSKIVTQYINDHEKTLPKIAVRETRLKLKTGKKTKSR